MNKIKIIYIDKKELVPLENNPRKVVDKNAIKKLTGLIKEHGFQNPLQVYKETTGVFTILCGNHRFKAGLELGMEKFPCVIYEGDRKKAIARSISDNKSSLWTEFDFPELKDIMAELDDGEFDMALTGFDEDEIKNMFDFGSEPDEKDDEIPDVDEKDIRCKLGDLWELGDHRLLCGDSKKREDVEKLMDGKKADMVFTDPPYGVSYADKNKFLNRLDKGNGVQKEIENDHMSLEKTGELWKNVFSVWNKYLAEYSCYYIASPQGGDLFMMMMMNDNGFPLKHCLIWNKNNHVLGRCDYMYKHEPILYGWKNKHKFYGKGSQDKSVINIDKPLKNELHPTMKPVELVVNFILNSTKKEMIVIDMFLGSGTTLIACEKTNRKCYGIELDPHYCDVIIKRWEEYAGKEAKLIQ